MGLIVCPCCERQREMKPIPRKQFTCSNCGVKEATIIRRVKAGIVKGDKDGVSRDEAQRQTYAGLLRYAEYRGYKKGWAANKYRALFGHFPSELIARSQPEPASAQLLHWIKKKNKDYAKAMREREQLRLAAKPEPTLPAIDYNGFVQGTYMTAADLDVKL